LNIHSKWFWWANQVARTIGATATMGSVRDHQRRERSTRIKAMAPDRTRAIVVAMGATARACRASDITVAFCGLNGMM
jgi:hypothetical protein